VCVCVQVNRNGTVIPDICFSFERTLLSFCRVSISFWMALMAHWDSYSDTLSVNRIRRVQAVCIFFYKNDILETSCVMMLGKWPTWRSILFYVFTSILYMFRATSCSSSGESFVSVQHLLYIILCRWPFRVQVGKFLSELHTKRSSTQGDIYQMLYWYNWFSWWWARGCSKHVENWGKYIKKCASSWSLNQECTVNKIQGYS